MIESRLILQQNKGNSIDNLRFYKDGILYSSQGKLYYNFDPVNILNSNNDDAQNQLKINNIVLDASDFYLLTDIGVFHNYKRIFSKEECFHLEKTSQKIFISCNSGIYQSELKFSTSKILEPFWQLDPKSPSQVNYFTLNSSKKYPEFASSNLGFFHYDVKANQWTKKNLGLNLDFQGSYRFGRFLYQKFDNKNYKIYLASAGGLYVWNSKSNQWHKSNQGLLPGSDGFYRIYEVGEFASWLYLISDTGLYLADPANSILKWTQVNLANFALSLDGFNNIKAISKHPSKLDTILLADDQGEIIEIQVKEFNQNLSQEVKTNPTIDSCEPSIQEVQKAALAFAGIPEGKQFASYRRGAKIRNWLPQIEAFLDRDRQNFLQIERGDTDNYNSNTSSINSGASENHLSKNDHQINAGFKAVWNLGNLLYDPVINDINTGARLSAAIRENLLTEVTQIYFMRKELLQSSDESNPEAKLKLEEYTAQLDARTGAWFSHQLKHCQGDKLII